MIGIVIVAHAGLASEFKNALEHIMGPQPAMAAITVASDDDMEECRNRLMNAITEVDQGRGVIVLSDMFGGTPSNLAISLLDDGKIEILAGVNLPLLVKLAELRKDNDLASTITQSQDAGRKHINIASQLLASYE